MVERRTSRAFDRNRRCPDPRPNISLQPFGVTPTGDVFARYSFGYHSDPARLYVTTLCPILNEAAELLLHRSIGEGGRFYVHPEVIERAADQTLLARLQISEDTMPG
jgi:hypothetical protein